MKENKKSFLPLFLIVFLDMVGLSIIIPIVAPIFLDPVNGILPGAYSLGTRTLIMGFLISSYPILQFFGAPLLGALSDRYGRKKILLLSLAGTFLGYILFGLGIQTKSLELLFLSRMIDGFTGGNISIVLSSISDMSDEKSKAKNFGLIGMAFGLGFILGPYIGGKLADPNIISWFNYSTPFWFAAGLSILNIIMVKLRMRETLETKIETKISFLTGFRNIRKAFGINNLRTAFIVIFLLTFGFTFFTQFSQVFLIEKFNFTQSHIGDLFAYIGLWIAFTQGVITRLVSKIFSPIKILSFSILLLSLTFPILLLPNKAWMLFLIMPFIAIFQGLTQPNSTAIVSNLSSKDSQGEILGINQSVQSLAMTIPPIISGIIVSIHINLPILLAGLSIFTAWLVFIIFYRKHAKEVFNEV